MATLVASDIVQATSFPISGAGGQNGDLVVAAVGSDTASVIAPTNGGADGWTEAESIVVTSEHAGWLGYQVLGSTVPTSRGFTHAGAIAYWIWRLEEGESWGDVAHDSSSGAGAGGAGSNTPSIASVSSQSVLMALFAHDDTASVSTPPSGMTAADTPVDTGLFAMAAYHQINPSDDPITRGIVWSAEGASNHRLTAILQVATAAGGGDTTAPTLSNASATATGSTTASGSVDTDEAGTVYAVITESATPPGDGDDIVGESVAGGVAYDSAVASGAGTVNLTFSGLDPATTYWMHVVATDAADNMSDIESSSSFETDAAGVTTLEADPFTAGASFADATFELVTQADPMAVTASFSDVTFSIDPGGFTLDAESMSVSASFTDAALNYDGVGFAHTLTADPFAVAALFADAALRQVVTNSAQATRVSVSISIGL